jgi:hypothetical protein
MCLCWKQIFARTRRTFPIKLGINHPLVEGIINSSNLGPVPLQRGDNKKKMQIWGGVLKIYWARISHVYMKTFWFDVNSKLFKSLSPGVKRCHNRENNIYMCLFWIKKKIFSRTSGLISIKLGTNHPWEKRILNCSKLRAKSFSKGRWSQTCKNGVGLFSKSSQEPLNQNRPYLHENVMI